MSTCTHIGNDNSQYGNRQERWYPSSHARWVPLDMTALLLPSNSYVVYRRFCDAAAGVVRRFDQDAHGLSCKGVKTHACRRVHRIDIGSCPASLEHRLRRAADDPHPEEIISRRVRGVS